MHNDPLILIRISFYSPRTDVMAKLIARSWTRMSRSASRARTPSNAIARNVNQLVCMSCAPPPTNAYPGSGCVTATMTAMTTPMRLIAGHVAIVHTITLSVTMDSAFPTPGNVMAIMIARISRMSLIVPFGKFIFSSSFHFIEQFHRLSILISNILTRGCCILCIFHLRGCFSVSVRNIKSQ